MRIQYRLSVAIFVLVLLSCGEGCRNATRSQTCSICGSTREQVVTFSLGFMPRSSEWKVLYAAPGFENCRHRWQEGINSGIHDPVPNGVVVLVRLGPNYGAFVLDSQHMKPEEAHYTWCFRSDGNAMLDLSDPSISRGTGRGANISFGPFMIHWSIATKGKGWLYYPHAPGEPVRPDDLHICVTAQREIRNINAADPKWVYKASPSDSGS